MLNVNIKEIIDDIWQAYPNANDDEKLLETKKQIYIMDSIRVAIKDSEPTPILKKIFRY